MNYWSYFFIAACRFDECRSVIRIEDEGFKSEILTTRTDFSQDQKVLASVRPENIHIHTSKPDESVDVWAARLERKNFLGGLFDMVVSIGDKELRCRTPFVIDAKSGTDVYIRIKPEDALLIDMH